MKKLFASTLILVVALLLISSNAFASRPLIFWNEGNIEGLVFAFDPPLPMDGLPGYPAFDVAYVHVETTGREVVVITNQMKFNYFGEFDAGYINCWSEVDSNGAPVGDPIAVVPMSSATLVESFSIDEIPDDPFNTPATDDVSMYFQANLDLGDTSATFTMVIWQGELVYAAIE